MLATEIAEIVVLEIETELSQHRFPQFQFVDDKLLIEKKVYIEHGHRYENFTTVDGPPVLQEWNRTQPALRIILQSLPDQPDRTGLSLYQRRAAKAKILPILIRERFPLAIKMLFRYIPFTLLIIPKNNMLMLSGI